MKMLSFFISLLAGVLVAILLIKFGPWIALSGAVLFVAGVYYDRLVEYEKYKRDTLEGSMKSLLRTLERSKRDQ